MRGCVGVLVGTALAVGAAAPAAAQEVAFDATGLGVYRAVAYGHVEGTESASDHRDDPFVSRARTVRWAAELPADLMKTAVDGTAETRYAQAGEHSFQGGPGTNKDQFLPTAYFSRLDVNETSSGACADGGVVTDTVGVNGDPHAARTLRPGVVRFDVNGGWPDVRLVLAASADVAEIPGAVEPLTLSTGGCVPPNSRTTAFLWETGHGFNDPPTPAPRPTVQRVRCSTVERWCDYDVVGRHQAESTFTTPDQVASRRAFDSSFSFRMRVSRRPIDVDALRRLNPRPDCTPETCPSTRVPPGFFGRDGALSDKRGGGCGFGVNAADVIAGGADLAVKDSKVIPVVAFATSALGAVCNAADLPGFGTTRNAVASGACLYLSVGGVATGVAAKFVPAPPARLALSLYAMAVGAAAEWPCNYRDPSAPARTRQAPGLTLPPALDVTYFLDAKPKPITLASAATVRRLPAALRVPSQRLLASAGRTAGLARALRVSLDRADDAAANDAANARRLQLRNASDHAAALATQLRTHATLVTRFADAVRRSPLARIRVPAGQLRAPRTLPADVTTVLRRMGATAPTVAAVQTAVRGMGTRWPKAGTVGALLAPARTAAELRRSAALFLRLANRYAAQQG